LRDVYILWNILYTTI